LRNNLCWCCSSLSCTDFYGNLHLVEMCQCFIDCLEISLHHCFATFAIRLFDALLDLSDCLFFRKDATNREETCLHNCVDAPSHTSVTCYLLCIDHIKTKLLF